MPGIAQRTRRLRKSHRLRWTAAGCPGGRFAAHVGNAVAELTPMGDLNAKDKKGSPRRIDAYVAADVAFEHAAWHLATRGRSDPRPRVVVLS